MLRILFWILVALDVAGVLLWYLLGLAAAGSAGTNPHRVTLLLLVLPLLLLGVAILLFVRGGAPGWRLLAVFLAASPLLLLVSLGVMARVQFRGALNDRGEMTFFRVGPLRELADAIARNDSTRVAALAPTVNLNQAGLAGMTPLMLAMRQLRQTPDRLEVLAILLAAGADPNRGAQAELPLAVAIQVSGRAGIGPVRLLLDAGADPNRSSEFGEPVFFQATGQSAPLEVLTSLLDGGADPHLLSRGGQTALFHAANSRNWKAARLLLERGADGLQGRSVNGQSFRDLLDSQAGEPDPDGERAAVRRLLERP